MGLAWLANMIPRGGLYTTFGAACLASLLGLAREASACSFVSGWYLAGDPGPVPANGAVVLVYSCSYGCDSPPSPDGFQLESEAGVLVPGSVVLSGVNGTVGFLVFRPESGALAADTVYAATLAGVSGSLNVTVLPEVDWSDTLALTEELSQVDSPAGDRVCCTSPMDSCGGTPCFQTEIDRRTLVGISWGDGVTPEGNQYAFRLLRAAGDDPPWSWSGAQTSFQLAEAEVTACYVLELQRLADGAIHRFDERCVERPDSFIPGVQPNLDENISSVLATCDAPPTGYEDPWCEARSGPCGGTSEPPCDSFAERCTTTGAGGTGTSSAAETVGGSTTTGNTSASSSQTGGSGEASATDAGTSGEGTAEEGQDTQGCTCAVPGNPSRGRAALVLIALGLAGLGRRRWG